MQTIDILLIALDTQSAGEAVFSYRLELPGNECWKICPSETLEHGTYKYGEYHSNGKSWLYRELDIHERRIEADSRLQYLRAQYPHSPLSKLIFVCYPIDNPTVGQTAPIAHRPIFFSTNVKDKYINDSKRTRITMTLSTHIITYLATLDWKKRPR